MKRVVLIALGFGLSAVVTADGKAADAAKDAVPDFSSANTAWVRVGIPFLDPQTGKILFEDPEHPFSSRGVNAQGRDTSGTERVPNWKDPLLQPWVSQKMKSYADMAMSGKIRVTAQAACQPGGVPGQMYYNEPLFILQSAKEVTLLYQRNGEARHVYMNVQHSKNPRSSFFGESVGHYEGDELVVDTIGFNDKTEMDNWGTPHSDAMHVVERYKMVNEGKRLNVTFTIDDPKAFTRPWSAVAVYRQVKGPMTEVICAENNFDFFEGKLYPIPQAKTADF